MSYLHLYRCAESEQYILTAERTEHGYYVGMMDADTFNDVWDRRCKGYQDMIELFEEMKHDYHLVEP